MFFTYLGSIYCVFQCVLRVTWPYCRHHFSPTLVFQNTVCLLNCYRVRLWDRVRSSDVWGEFKLKLLLLVLERAHGCSLGIRSQCLQDLHLGIFFGKPNWIKCSAVGWNNWRSLLEKELESVVSQQVRLSGDPSTDELNEMEWMDNIFDSRNYLINK